MTIRIVESKVEAAKSALREFIANFKLGKEESVIQKGYRLYRDGKVTVAINRPDFVSGTVQGDTGTYEVKIYRSDPKSYKTTYDVCECWIAGTSVVMADGSVRPIETLRVGDAVMTATGRLGRVTHTFERDYEGKIYGLRTKGGTTTSWATATHGLPLADFSRVEAKDVEQGMELLFPRMKARGFYGLDVRQFIDGGDELMEVDGFLRKRAKCFGEQKKVRLPWDRRRPPILAHWSFDDEWLMRFLGLYVAEGMTTNRGEIRLIFHKDERGFIEESAEALRRLGCRTVNIKDHKTANSCTVVGYSALLVEVLNALTGTGAKTKRLHESIMEMDEALLRPFIDGWCDGDGHDSPTGRTTVATASDDLAMQLRLLLGRIGVSSVIRRKENNVSEMVPGGTSLNVVIFRTDGVDRKKNVYFEGGQFIQKMRKPEVREFTGKVYNIEVADTLDDNGMHTYVVGDGLASFNCDWESYRWDRTRGWKHLEGKKCSHIRALQLASQSTPLDMSEAEEGYKPAPGQRVKPLTEKEKAERDFDKNDGAIPGLAEQGEAERAKSLPRSFGPDGEILDEGWQEKPDPSLMDNKNLLRQPMENPFLAPKPEPPKGDNPLVAPQQRKPMTLHDFVGEDAPQPGPGQMSMPNMAPPGSDPEDPQHIPGTFSSVRTAAEWQEWNDPQQGVSRWREQNPIDPAMTWEDWPDLDKYDTDPQQPNIDPDHAARNPNHYLLDPSTGLLAYKYEDDPRNPNVASERLEHAASQLDMMIADTVKVYEGGGRYTELIGDDRADGIRRCVEIFRDDWRDVLTSEQIGAIIEREVPKYLDDGEGDMVRGARVAALDDRIFEPMEDVLIDVQLESPDDPSTWVRARIVEHRPDTEGEAWDEDDYVIEWSEGVPEDGWCSAQTEDGKCEVPASWVHGVAEDWSDQEPVWPEEKVYHRAHVRIAMAERTGIPRLDALIEEFMAANPAVVGDAGVGYLKGDPDSSLDQMRNPEYAQGKCGLIAHQFTGWLLERGIVAWTTDDMGEGHQADWHGYEDRPGEGSWIDTSHCATAIEWEGYTYLVDWSASQYGYEEWPMVQRTDMVDQRLDGGAPRWERDFIASTDIPVFVVTASDFHYGSDEVERQITEALRHGRRVVFALRNPVALEASGGKIPVPGAEPIGENEDGLPIYRWQELGWDPIRQRRVNQNEMFDDQVGSPPLKGQYGLAQPGRSGEILDYEPLLRSVFVHIPINDMGKLHHHLLSGWVDLDDITLLDTDNELRSPFRARQSKTAMSLNPEAFARYPAEIYAWELGKYTDHHWQGGPWDKTSTLRLQMVPLDRILGATLYGTDTPNYEYSMPGRGWEAEYEGERDGYYTSLEDAIRTGGDVAPLVLVAQGDGTYESEDGWHRASIARSLGLTHLPAYVYDPSL